MKKPDPKDYECGFNAHSIEYLLQDRDYYKQRGDKAIELLREARYALNSKNIGERISAIEHIDALLGDEQ